MMGAIPQPMRSAPDGIDTGWLRMETIPPTRRQRRSARRERRQTEARDRRAWLLGDIARLEYELGITDEKPSGTVIVDGYSIPVPTLGPDPGVPSW